jgi:hypothetical protein
VQLELEVSETMNEMDDLERQASLSYQDCLKEGNLSSNKSEDGFSSFLSFFKHFLNEPYGSRLFEQLHDIINELELPDEFLTHLKSRH